MAAVKSLGVHTPTALPRLIAEGILPVEASANSYEWETYVFQTSHGVIEEEVFYTKTLVVWSQGHFSRNVYRFDQENEDVVQALLTTFPASLQVKGDRASRRDVASATNDFLSSTKLPQNSRSHAARDTSIEDNSGRALVVILKTKACMYFLQGGSHITDLPFEIARAFPAPHGLLLQRKKAGSMSKSSIRVPSVPQNSFMMLQGRASLSYLQSPTLLKSFANIPPARPSPLGGSKKFETLFQDLLMPKPKLIDDDIANIYSLSGPLEDFGVVTSGTETPQHLPRPTLKSSTRPNIQFDPLDAGESIIYITPESETLSWSRANTLPLILLVTHNSDTGWTTVWHAWYLENQSLRFLLEQRAKHKADKARRRSSFMSAGILAGAATPAVRRGDGGRESFVPPGTLRVPTESQAALVAASTRKKPTKQEEEQAMRSQMDPDFRQEPQQQSVRQSRRISSMNADVRASHPTVNASFGGPASRRATSFGGDVGRRSLGRRKSRASTPGAGLNNSTLIDEQSMDLDVDNDQTIDDIVRYIRSTHESAGMDSVFGSADDDFKQDLVVRRLFSCPSSAHSSLSGTDVGDATIKVVTLVGSQPLSPVSHGTLSIFLHQRSSNNTRRYHLRLVPRVLWPESATSPLAVIPLLDDKESADLSCHDMIKLGDGQHEVVNFDPPALLFAPHDDPSPLSGSSASYRRYTKSEVLPFSQTVDKDVGKNRILPAPSGSLTLQRTGARAAYDEATNDGVQHRRKIKIMPESLLVESTLLACELILPTSSRMSMRKLWCAAYAGLDRYPTWMAQTSSDRELVALAAVVQGLAILSLDKKSRTSLDQVCREAQEVGAEKQTSLKIFRSEHERSRLASRSWTDLEPAHEVPRDPVEHKDVLPLLGAMVGNDLVAENIIAVTTCFPAGGGVHMMRGYITNLMICLQMVREEHKLSALCEHQASLNTLAAIIVQLGTWLSHDSWTCQPGTLFALDGTSEDDWKFVHLLTRTGKASSRNIEPPLSIYQWFEQILENKSAASFASVTDLLAVEVDSSNSNPMLKEYILKVTPRTTILTEMIRQSKGFAADPVTIVELMAKTNLSPELLDSMPAAIAAPFKAALAHCERQPPTTWSTELLQLVGRHDLVLLTSGKAAPAHQTHQSLFQATRDVSAICQITENTPPATKTREAGRHAVSQLVFSEDRRLIEAIGLMHFNSTQVVECPKQPEWDDAMHLDHQRRMMIHATTRMIAMPCGDGMIHYDSQTPLLTERYHLPGFNSSCLIYPMGHTLTTDRSGLTEEKVNWAYFHAGVSAGLRVSRNAIGIDTSWVAFNKPNELTNRHAGLLLALGLSGHLRNLAKWLSFRYLTPKHTMTSVGLLLGLSASHIGTMDSLVTRMLSVHITRMLPPGASELNVSSITQTAGLMGIGLLYHDTQHRRMSEIMLSEIEFLEVEDPDSGPDTLRDESYRLAAGFALGLINIGRGSDLRGLHGMRMPERLLAIAVGPRPVNAVHVFDRATAGAVMALALLFMKTGDRAVASKIDIPDTEAQFDHIRPDVLLLRAMTKHIILWDDIVVAEGPGESDGSGWISRNCPACYRKKPLAQAILEMLRKRTIDSSQIPLFNIYTGLAWALSLKYAGTGNTTARDEILSLLSAFHSLNEGVEAFYFDGKLGRASLRRCMDILALSAAVVMAGTGDLSTFRYLRRMHGRVDADTPYGSHLAAHMAIGVLFLGGGTFTLGTSDLAVAVLMCAFYPLFPTDVHDNRVHLQAFRHLWVLAAEARCIVAEDIDTRRPIHMPIKVTSRDGTTKHLRSPCLLPDLQTIAVIETADPSYWRIRLDFANNPSHLESFRRDQRILVRKCPIAEAHSSVFSATLASLQFAETQSPFTQMALASGQQPQPQIWHSIFSLPAFKSLDKADIELILPPDVLSDRYDDARSTAVDERLVLRKAAEDSDRQDALWNLRVLFAWAERASRDDRNGVVAGKIAWLGREVIEALRGKVEERVAAAVAAAKQRNADSP
jgi:anaphase-promoting complex subunit 1